MIQYLVLHSLLTLGVLLLLWALRDAPPRLRLWIACVGVFLWAVPAPVLTIPVEVTEDLMSHPLMTFKSEVVVTPVLAAGDGVMKAAGELNLSWFWLNLFVLGFLFWLRSLQLHHCEVARLNKSARDGSYLWDELALYETIPLKIIPGSLAMTTGWFKPTIWIGEDHLESEALRAVLVHELTHVRQRDNRWVFLLHLWENLFWWNPLLKAVSRRARFYVELSCDHMCGQRLGVQHYQQALATLILHSAGMTAREGMRTHLFSSGKENMARLKQVRPAYPMRMRYLASMLVFVVFGSFLVARPVTKQLELPSIVEEAPVAKSENPPLKLILDDDIPRVGEAGVDPPIFTRKIAPVFPEKAWPIRLQGYVILEAVLRKDGVVDDIKVLRGLGRGKFGFEESAIDAIEDWKFIPGKVNGKPSDVRMTLKIDFVITE